MPFYMKALLAVAGVVVAGWVVVSIVGWFFSSLLYIAVGAVAVGALYYGYHKFMMSIPAYRRKQIQKKREY
ncbi:MAG TPA: hypothetical protein VGX23_35995 [Actinocrinis sp.]|nr:hypothetical protein [Actinocrinis sp.]